MTIIHNENPVALHILYVGYGRMTRKMKDIMMGCKKKLGMDQNKKEGPKASPLKLCVKKIFTVFMVESLGAC